MTEQNNKLYQYITHLQELVIALMLNNNSVKSNWYNRVYLCYEELYRNQPNDSLPIKGFKCYRYNSFENANKGWNNDREEFNKMNIRYTMIPMCKWMPQIFDKYILNRKLRNIYWLGKHTLGQGYNSKSFNEK